MNLDSHICLGYYWNLGIGFSLIMSINSLVFIFLFGDVLIEL